MLQREQRLGRPPKTGETVEKRVPLDLTRSELALLEERRGDVPRATYIKRLIEQGLQPTPDLGLLNLLNLKFLTAAPCGDWDEAIAHAGEFVISRDVANYMGVTAEHVIVRALNTSMEGAGIYDGDLLVMETLGEHALPRSGDIALVQVFHGDDVSATIKRWNKSGHPPQLTDGEHSPFNYPDGVTLVQPVAVVKGIVGRR